MDYCAIDIGNDQNDDAIGQAVLFIYMIWFTYHLYNSSISFHSISFSISTCHLPSTRLDGNAVDVVPKWGDEWMFDQA